MEARDTLLFIPDITGFTNFVNETEISHAKHIITELLETIMQQNELNFELAEVEGDALFYYSGNHRREAVVDVLEMSKAMFLAFHQQLLLYEQRRVCQCGACSSAVNLSLKFIVHRGNMEIVEFNGSKKPFGADVIVAHKLLKNNIDLREYIMLTKPAFDPKGAVPSWFQAKEATEGLAGTGDVEIVYGSLEGLLAEVPPLPELARPKKTPNPIILEDRVAAKPGEVYELISNLDLRTLWNKKIDRMEYDKQKLNQQGEKHLCVIDGKEFEFQTISDDFGDDSWVYGEVTKDIPILKSVTNYFIIKKIGDETLLRIESHFKPLPYIGFIFTPLIRMVVKKELGRSFNAIKSYLSNRDAVVAA